MIRNLIPAILTILLISAPGTAQTPSQAIPGVPGVRAERLYNGINRPMWVHVQSPDGASRLGLVAMDHHGTATLPPALVGTGRVNLAEALEGLWSLRQTVYLQLLADGQAVGPALVLQPMLTRMVPITKPAMRNGNTYTQITGFKSELELDATPVEGDQSGGGEPDAPKPTPAPVCTGVRAYVDHDVIFGTTQGEIRLAMRPDVAPNTVWNFITLAGGGFYDDTIVHRIVPFDREGRPFVIQGGDPAAHAEGGPGYWLPIEPSSLAHDFGVISMARSDDPDSAGSQWFICLSREGTARLDGQYCAFGEAVSGIDTIRSIADQPLADVERGRPKTPPIIHQARLVPAPPRQPATGRPDLPLAIQIERFRRDAETEARNAPGRVPR